MKQTIEINHKICKYAEIIEDKEKNKRIARLYLDESLDREEHFLDEPIQTDREDEYFYLPHLDYLEKHPELSKFGLFCSFSTRPADAIGYVINGVADAVLSRKSFFASPFEKRNPIRPVIFLDKEVGQKMRKKTIDGWKNTKFKWALSRINGNSFSAIREFLRKDYQTLKTDEPIDKVFCLFEVSADVDGIGKIAKHNTVYGELPDSEIYFADTEKEIEEMIPKVKNEIIEMYKKIPETTDKEAMDEINRYEFKPFQYLLIEE